MNVDAILVKMKSQLNKLDSSDYDNIEIWQLLEAFNRAARLWTRANLHGLNPVQEGDEGSKRRIDDFSVLLKTEKLSKKLTKNDYVLYKKPDDYFVFKRIDVEGKKDCCENKKFIVYLSREYEVNHLLKDDHRKPDFEWGETFCTFTGDGVKIYKDGFDITKADITYYRYPALVRKQGHLVIEEGQVATTDEGSEFNDDVTEVIISYAVKLIAGDIADINNYNVRDAVTKENN